MSKNLKLFKKITCILGITFLVLGVVPLPMISRIATAAAETEGPGDAEPPAEEPKGEEAPVEEPEVKEPPAEERPEKKAPPVKKQPKEDGDLPMLSFAVIGDDPDVEDLIIDHNNYSNGTCNSNPTYCEDLDPVTNPNQYTDMTTYGSKTYTLPQIGGEYPTILVVKNGPNYYWFENGSSKTCVANTFCVEFNDATHEVTVRSYIPTQNGWDGYNLIDVWLPAPKDCEPTYTDANCPTTPCGLPASDHSNGCGGTVHCQATDACACVPDAWSCPTGCGYAGGTVTDSCQVAHQCSATPLCGDDDDDDDDDDTPGGGGGGTTVIPVTGEPLIIPVTGVEYTIPFAALQQLSMYLGLMLFGITMVLEGIDRKRTR